MKIPLKICSCLPLDYELIDSVQILLTKVDFKGPLEGKVVLSEVSDCLDGAQGRMARHRRALCRYVLKRPVVGVSDLANASLVARLRQRLAAAML